MDLLRAWWDEVCLFAVTWLVNLYPVVCVFPQLHTQSDKLYLTCIHRAEPHCALLDGCERVHWCSWYLKYKAEGLILNYHLTDVCVSADYGFELTLWDFNKHAERVSTVPFLFNKSTLSQFFFSWWNSQFNGNNQKDSSPCSHDALRPLHEAAWANMMEEAASQLERDHVHNVYDKIAPYFNDSRYKAWPKVRQFLLELQPGSIVADIGGSPAVMWSWKSNYSWLTFLVLCCSWLSCLSRLW